MRPLLACFFALLLAGCSAGNLTSRQQAYDVVGKAEAVLTIALRVVETPEIPPEIKRHIKLASQVVTEAVAAYVGAVKADAGVSHAAAAAANAIASLVGYLVSKGYMGVDERAASVAPSVPVFAA
jgi:hypothetical protein